MFASIGEFATTPGEEIARILRSNSAAMAVIQQLAVAACELFGDADFTAMKKGKLNELFAAWLTLMKGQRNAMDAEFCDIFEMSCEKGFLVIIDETEFQLGEDEFTTWMEKLSALPSHYDRTMLVFLDRNNL